MSGRIIVAWTGASGLVYGTRLVEVLLAAGREVHLMYSPAVRQTAPVELGRPVEDLIAALGDDRLHVCKPDDFSEPAASGSAEFEGMAICPCSMSTLARVATGTGDTLLLRAADVCRKERRRLILVPRETPLATHHLRHMADLSADGVTVLPAMPGFYTRPTRIEDLVDFIVQRICDRLDVPSELGGRWGDAT